MSILGLLFVSIAAIAGFWLVRQGILQSPWLEEGELVDHPGFFGRALSRPPASKVGLGVFLAVATCLFLLMTAAFFMRMESPDWQAPPAPAVLWFNTAALVASSVALQMAQFAVRQRDIRRARTALMIGGACAVMFLIGQLWAWRELIALGFYASSNPANAFFFLLTGAHGLHLIGGLVALARTTWQGASWEKAKAATLATSVELCAIYWHFLLLIWLLLFAMMTGWANNLGVLCRRLLS